MTDSSVIYEVTLEVEPAVIETFDQWLAEHMQAMLQMPGFRAARLLPASETDAKGPNGRLLRVVQYTVASQADLDAYFRDHAARMRADGIQRFGDRFSAQRRTLADAGAALDKTTQAPALRCLNCGTPLTGRYCVECGQPNHTVVAPLWETVEEFFGNHFGLDTKFFHSIVPLLLKPGFLTREYCAGRRERYIKPLRLYLFSSILFFFCAAWLMPPHFGNPAEKPASDRIQITPDSGQARKKLEAAITRIQTSPGMSETEKAALIATLQDQLDAMNRKPAGTPVRESGIDFMSTEAGKNVRGNSDFGQRLAAKLKKIEDDRQGFENELFYHTIPKVMFVFLPLVALMLKLFYIRRRHLYMEHLIFTLHCHALFFIALLASVAIGAMTTHYHWPASIKSTAESAINWYLVIYLFLALRNFYQQSWLKTLVKFCLLFFGYFVLATLGFLGALALAFVEV